MCTARQYLNPEPQCKPLSGLVLSQKGKNVQILRSGGGQGIPEESTLTGRENKPSPGLGADLSLRYNINKLLNLFHPIFLSIKKELALSEFPNQIVYLHHPGETMGERSVHMFLLPWDLYLFQAGELGHPYSPWSVPSGIPVIVRPHKNDSFRRAVINKS